MTKCADEKIELIMIALEGKVHNPNIFTFLRNLQTMSRSLVHGERSETFHNTLKGFNRMWGDEFAPEDATVSPLLEELFEMHGFPAEKWKAK